MNKSTSIVLIEQSSQLAKLDRPRQMLVESRKLDEVKKVKAANVYATAAHFGRHSQNYAAEIALLHRGGLEILTQLHKMPK